MTGGIAPAASPPEPHREAWQRLQALLSELGGVLVAFSGGLDSTFLLAAGRMALGDQVLAATACSEMFPEEETLDAACLAEFLEVEHRRVAFPLFDLPEFGTNPPDRCYFCKKALFSAFLELAREEGLAWVADGENLDDLGDHRPGSRATAELGVRSPLREAGLGKADIRALSRWLDLPTWDKPSMACLASRFPYGTAITRERVERIGLAETALRELGLTQVRLRCHDEVGRLEVPPDDLGRLVAPDLAEQVVSIIKEAGFTYAGLDLQGYRPGSMNEVSVPSGSNGYGAVYRTSAINRMACGVRP